MIKQLAKQNVWGEGIWVGSNFLLARNLASFPFPTKLDATQSKQLIDLMKESIAESFPDFHFYENASLSHDEKELLQERFFLGDPLRSDTIEQGFALDKSGTFLITINHFNHVLIQCIEKESDWTQTSEKLLEIESVLGHQHRFAFSPKFGYLSSSLSNCGTGLSVQAFLHVPALTHHDSFEGESTAEVKLTGMGGNDYLLGDILVIENQHSIGLTEDHIMDTVHQAANHWMHLEKRAREKLKETPNPLINDRISRAFALLTHSYQMETKEALEALSMIKLGIALKWISGKSEQDINQMFFLCQRGHLSMTCGGELSLPAKRAEFLKTHLKGLRLKFP